MKYFIAVLGILSSVSLNAMDGGSSDDGANSNYPQADEVKKMLQQLHLSRVSNRVVAYNTVSDAMFAEENFALSLKNMVDVYVNSLMRRRELINRNIDSKVIKEQDEITNSFWGNIHKIVNQVDLTKETIKIIIDNEQPRMVYVPDWYRRFTQQLDINASNQPQSSQCGNTQVNQQIISNPFSQPFSVFQPVLAQQNKGEQINQQPAVERKQFDSKLNMQPVPAINIPKQFAFQPNGPYLQVTNSAVNLQKALDAKDKDKTQQNEPATTGTSGNEQDKKANVGGQHVANKGGKPKQTPKPKPKRPGGK